jgi:hypothetical protein
MSADRNTACCCAKLERKYFRDLVSDATLLEEEYVQGGISHTKTLKPVPTSRGTRKMMYTCCGLIHFHLAMLPQSIPYQATFALDSVIIRWLHAPSLIDWRCLMEHPTNVLPFTFHLGLWILVTLLISRTKSMTASPIWWRLTSGLSPCIYLAVCRKINDHGGSCTNQSEKMSVSSGYLLIDYTIL